MKHYPWIFLSAGLLALAFAPGACGGSNNGGGGSTSASTTTTTKSTSLTTGTGTGGALTCTDILDPSGDDCATCLDDGCCDLVTACAGDSDCTDCFNAAADQSVCDANAAWTAFYACESSKCKAECIPVVCNPVTSAECTAATEGCDLSADGKYHCFAGETEALCAKCDYNTDLYCAPGLYCIADDTLIGTCARYCCDDGDCGTGTCDKTGFPDGVGLCVAKANPDAGADAGTAVQVPACDAPAVAPSGGSCFTGM